MAAITDLTTLSSADLSIADLLVVHDSSAVTDKKLASSAFPFLRRVSKASVADNSSTALARLQASGLDGYASAHLLIVSAGGSHASTRAYIGVWSYGTFTLTSLASGYTNSTFLEITAATVNVATPYVDFNVTHDSSLGLTATVYLTVIPLHSNSFVEFSLTAL